LVALKEAGVSDNLIAVMMNPTAPSALPSAAPPPAAPARAAAASSPAPKPAGPAANGPKEVAATETRSAPPKAPARPVVVSSAPADYGVYIWSEGELKPLGRVQTKVQVSKFRTLLKTISVPFVRQKIDINIPGAHSTSRFELDRPTFFAFFPPSRDVSKFKLLQCKITGQRFDQRTLANASVLFSTEQNQDEVPCDIGPTAVKDLYRISPREDIPSGEFGFVEGKLAEGRLLDASLADDKSKEVVPARHLDFVGGYAGLWKATFDQKSIRLPLLQSGTPEITFEARLNQNLDFKAKFQTDKINDTLNPVPAGQH
jgi:hypothetical protein